MICPQEGETYVTRSKIHDSATRFVLAGSLVVGLSAGNAGAQTGSSSGPWQTYGTENGEWRSYAGDVRGTKYSPLDQIDAANFTLLELQWEWTSVDNYLSRTMPDGGEWTAPLDVNRGIARGGHPKPLPRRTVAEPVAASRRRR